MIINLTDGFEPFGKSDIKFEHITFPSGVEQNVKFINLPDFISGYTYNEVDDSGTLDVLFTIRISGAEDIMTLLLATDAVRRRSNNKNISIGVFFPYVPYARQDRVMVKGEALSIKVFADLINSQNYSWVGFYDVHSDVTLALINNSYNYFNTSLWAKVLSESLDAEGNIEYYLCSPDAGASKKVGKLVENVRPLPIDIIQCNKVRDLNTGKIAGLTVSHSDLGGKDVYIVDDICSRGGTFMMIAQKLKELNAGKIYLVVSHWENSADFKKIYDSGIAGVYFTDSMQDITPYLRDNYTPTDFIQLKLEELL